MPRLALACLLLAALACRPRPTATAAPGLVGHGSAMSTNNNTVTTPGLNMSGATLELVSCITLSGVPTLTDSGNNVWKQIGAQSGVTTVITTWESLTPAASSSQTFTCSLTGAYPAIFVQGFSGFSAASALDQQNGAYNSGNATTVQTGAITPTQASELVVSVFGPHFTQTAYSVDSGLNITDTQPGNANAFGGAIAYQIQSAATTINPTWTTAPAQNNLAASIFSFYTAPPAPQATTTVISGSTPMLTTPVPGGGCDASPLTVSAPGALASDTTSISPTSNASTAGYGSQGFNLSWSIGAGSLSFVRCNVTSGSKAPGPLTLNWRVLR